MNNSIQESQLGNTSSSFINPNNHNSTFFGNSSSIAAVHSTSSPKKTERDFGATEVSFENYMVGGLNNTTRAHHMHNRRLSSLPTVVETNTIYRKKENVKTPPSRIAQKQSINDKIFKLEQND